MSGGNSTSRYAWSTDGATSCVFHFQTPLNSPDVEVLKKLTLQAALNIEIIVDDGRQILGAIHPNFGLAGVITAMQGAQMLKCIEEGHRYVAVVTFLDVPACRVEIRNVQL